MSDIESEKDVNRDRLAFKESLYDAINRHASLWPQAIATAIGLLLLGLLALPTVNLETVGQVVNGVEHYSYMKFSAFQLMFGLVYLGEGSFNAWIAMSALLLGVGQVLPLFGKKNAKGWLVASTIVSALGLLMFFLFPSYQFLSLSFRSGSPFLKGGTIIPSRDFGLINYGYWVTILCFGLWLLAPYAARSISLSIGKCHLIHSVKFGKKLANY